MTLSQANFSSWLRAGHAPLVAGITASDRRRSPPSAEVWPSLPQPIRLYRPYGQRKHRVLAPPPMT